MIAPTPLPSLVIGVVAGIVLVVACGGDGDTPIDAARAADAAACECPTAEPPIAGRIAVRRSATPVAPLTTTDAYFGCEPGEDMLGGGCLTYGPGEREVVLNASGPTEAGPWQCRWTSSHPNDVDGYVEVFCLTPSP